MKDAASAGRSVRASWDVAVSVCFLVFTLMLGGFAVLATFFAFPILGNCGPPNCNSGRAITAVSVTLLATAVFGLGGSISTVVRIARRQTSWHIAVGIFLLCLLTCLAGVVWFVGAVGI